MTFYQVFDSGRFCVLHLEGRGLQRKREEAIVDLYHDASNSQETKMLFSYNCIFAQGYCSYTTLSSIVSQVRNFKELRLILTAGWSQLPFVFLLW